MSEQGFAQQAPATIRKLIARRNVPRVPARAGCNADLALRILDHLAEQASPIALTAVPNLLGVKIDCVPPSQRTGLSRLRAVM
jgi:hypothetical protein